MKYIKYDALSIITANKHNLSQCRTQDVGYMRYQLIMEDVKPSSIDVDAAITESYYRLHPSLLHKASVIPLDSNQRDFRAELRDDIAPLFNKLSGNVNVDTDGGILIKNSIIKPFCSDNISSSREAVNLPHIVKKLREGLDSMGSSDVDLEILVTIMDAYNSMPCLATYVASPKFVYAFGMIFFYTFVHSQVLSDPSVFKVIVIASIENLYLKSNNVSARIINFIRANPLSIQFGAAGVWFAIHGVYPMYTFAKEIFLMGTQIYGVIQAAQKAGEAVKEAVKEAARAIADEVAIQASNRDNKGPGY